MVNLYPFVGLSALSGRDCLSQCSELHFSPIGDCAFVRLAGKGTAVQMLQDGSAAIFLKTVTNKMFIAIIRIGV